MSSPSDPLEPELLALESELRSLRPIEPDFTVSQRLTRAMGEVPRPRPVRHFEVAAVTGGRVMDRVGRSAAIPFAMRKYVPWAAAAAVAVLFSPFVNHGDLSVSGRAPAGRRFSVSPAQIKSFAKTKTTIVLDLSTADADAEAWSDHRLRLNPQRSEDDPSLDAGELLIAGNVGFLGVSVDDLSDEGHAYLAQLNLADNIGVQVRKCYLDFPAYHYGLRLNDVIMEIDGQPVKDMADFKLRIQSTKPESIVEFTIVRGDRPAVVRVRLGAAPSA